MPGKGRWLKRRKAEEKRIKDQDMIKTVEEVFDSITLTYLYRLLAKGPLKDIKGVVHSGKEARVYWGILRDGRDVAVKIYLSFSAEFRKSIRKYIEGDPRFESIPKGNFRKLIYEWTRKEFRNLKRLYQYNVRVPQPITFYGNILVMQFIGEKGRRAPLLAEIASELDVAEIREIYNDLALNIERIVCEAGIIHADLSEFNVMIFQGVPWIIDVSQAVHFNHPHAEEFLQRDINNIYRFFEPYIERLELEELAQSLKRCLREWREGKRDQGSM